MKKILLLVDDHPLFRRGVKELIIDQCDLFEKVVEADSGIEALQQVECYSPECVMLDIAMPGIDGLTTLDMIKSHSPTIRCIILSMYDKPEFVIEARKRGADGYILKTDSDAVIIECLQRVNNGAHYISGALQGSIDLQLPEIRTDVAELERLSTREREVLALIAKNHTSKEIAQHLDLSLRTIQNHRVNICRKLELSGPNALLKVAIENQSWF